MLLGIISTSGHGIGEGTTGQRVDVLVEGAKQAFNMSPEVRPSDRAPMQINAVCYRLRENVESSAA
jgi:hypothetical protein